MDPIYYKDNDDRQFYDSISKLTDRELQEKQTHYLWQLEKSNNRIKKNIIFFFYLSIVMLLISVVLLSKIK